MIKIFRLAVATGTLSTILLAPAINVQAGTIVQCGEAVCSSGFSIDFNDNIGVGTGELLYDSTTGAISLNTDLASTTGNAMVVGERIVWTMNDGSQIRVDGLSGNADPVLIFGLGATTSGSGSTFGFTFNLPIALQGPINANSEVAYTLTAGSGAGAQIAPIDGKVVSAFEVDTSVGGIGSLNKGVDVGDTFFFTVGPDQQTSPDYIASSSFTGDLAYDVMSVQVDFALSANSAVGISGFVQQVVVPVPAAVWLFGSGLLGLVAVARRKTR